MKRSWLIAIVILAVVGFWTAKKYFNKDISKEKISSAKAEGAGYWTCVMHPQIHMDHAGECPICHMKLVQVKVQEAQVAQAVATDRSEVQASSGQLELIGIQKQEVEKMDLSLSVPVAGRLISSSNIAFQIYESDLNFIKAGLRFKGRSSFAPDAEIIGTITSVDSIVDPTSRTVRAIGRIDKGPRSLISETTFSGVISVLLKDRIAVPESSVLHTGTGDLVYVIDETNKLLAREIQLGPKAESFYEVLSGLEAGESISSGPNFLIDSEAKLRGTSNRGASEGKPGTPTCPEGEHWDLPMAMCMPGKAAK